MDGLKPVLQAALTARIAPSSKNVALLTNSIAAV